MTITRNIKIVFCLLMFPFCCAMAQEEYTWEMGGVIGGSFYMGDANSSTPFKDTGIAGGFIARYLLNPHMAIKGNLTAGRISGDTRDFKNVYPNGEYATFKRTIIDLGAQFEYNFLGYGTEYAQLASEKAKFYEQYKEAKEELLKLKTAKQNVASFFREEEQTQQER